MSAPVSSSATRSIVIKVAMSLVLAVAFAAALAPYLQTIPSDLRVTRWAIPAYLATLIPYHLLRASRWQCLVRPLGPINIRTTVLVGLAGYMWIALLPFRLGEFARPLFLRQRSSIKLEPALGSVAIERVVDGLVVCGLFFVGVLGRPAPQLEGLYWATFTVMGVFGLALLTLAVMAWMPETTGELFRRLVAPLHAGLAHKLASIVTGVARGLTALPSGGPLLAFVGLTLAYWLTNALGMWVLAQGCGLPLGLRDAIAVLAVMNIALMVPGGPAQFGIFQTGVAVGLALYLPADLVHARGSTFAFYLYVCQLGTIVLAGLVAQRVLALEWRALFDRSATRPPEDSGPSARAPDR